jgi:hypothetical protein
MHRDPTMIGRTNVMAETFAGVINAFVEQISWKTMVSIYNYTANAHYPSNRLVRATDTDRASLWSRCPSW